MSNDNQIIVLGTGTSTGVPIVGCHCKVCQSDNIFNKRLRSSIAIRTKTNKTIIVDTTPDFRTQVLHAKIDQVDGVIITHDHADHTHGIDDLRPFGFWQKESIPLFTNQITVNSLKQKFQYIFDFKSISKGGPVIGGGIPKIHLEVIQTKKEDILGESFEFFELPHGYTPTLSFIHSKMAYIVDCKTIPKAYLERLKEAELEVLIIDCAKDRPHDTHLHFEKSIEYIQAIQPSFAGLIHMGHELEHQEMINRLDAMNLNHVRPLFDGQSLYYK